MIGCVSHFLPRITLPASLMLALATSVSAQPTNLEIVGIQVSEQSPVPGEAVAVTYHLRSSGPLLTAFNMGIFVRKGPHGTWAQRWGLPSQMLDALEGGGRISQTWQVEIPHWEDGNYIISVHADPDNFVSEADEEDNEDEISVFASSEGVGMTSIPLARPQPVSANLRCGDDTLRIKVANTSLWPGAKAEIDLLSIRSSRAASNIPIQVSADGGSFEEVTNVKFLGSTGADGRAFLTWKPPDVKSLGGKGDVNYYLSFHAFDFGNPACVREIAVNMSW
jgi:hypothetical protein